MLLLHVSDTHLGATKPGRHGRLRERELDFYEAFDEVVDIAIKEGVDAVLHCGDLFDEPKPNPQTYYYAIKSLKKLRDAGIYFFVISGQHDQPKTSALSPLRLLDEIGLAKTLAVSDVTVNVVSLRSGELGITAVPYTPPQLASDVVKALRRPNSRKRVLMGHLLLKELNLPVAHLSVSELGVQDFNYVALGDYHMRYELSHHDVPVVYPGSTEALNVVEASDERYVALVDLSADEARINWIKLSRFRKWLVLDNIANYNQLLRVLSTRLINSSKPPILYVKITNKDLSSTESRLIGEYLDSLVRSGRVLFYRVEIPNMMVEEEGSEVTEVTYVPTLDNVVHDVIGDKELASILVGIIKGCDDVEFVKAMVSRLVSDDELLNRLERLVRRNDRKER